MSGFRQFLFRLRAIVARRRIEAELSDEIRIHLEMAAEQNIAAGMPPSEARLAARRQFGGIEQVKESYRDERVLVGLDQFAGDVRMAVRSLLRARSFTATVLVIIGLCLAANVVIFSMINSVLLRPLPFHDPERLVAVRNNYPKAGLLRTGVSVPHYLERRKGIAAFEEAAGIRYDTAYLDTAGAPEGVEAADVTPSFFRVLGVNAALGRTFTDDEVVEGRNKVVLLSDGFWRERYGADPSAVGKKLRVDNEDYTIIGVMPAGFRYLSYSSRLWGTLSFSDYERSDAMRHADSLDMIARLRPGATIAQAQAQLDSVDAAARKIDPMAEMVRSVGYFSRIYDLHADHVANFRQALLLLQAGVLFLLLIGTVNLANLLMVRATGRAKEFSVRQVLGAGRMQLVRALLVEAILLSVAGGVVGIGLGALSLRMWSKLAIERLPSEATLALDPTVCAFALGISLVLGLLLALPVILLTIRGSLVVSLSAESRTGTTAGSVHRLRHGLIVAQIALAFVLLSGAGLLGLSFRRLLDVPPGFRRDNLVTGKVTLSWWSEYKEPAKRSALIARLLSDLRSQPGAVSAAISEGVPFSGTTWVSAWSIVGPSPAQDEFIKEGMFVDAVSGGYFTTLGIPLLEGRLLDDDDVLRKRMVCVVDEEFAKRHWPHGGAVGQQIERPYDPGEKTHDHYTIVGVVGSVKQADLADQREHAAAYLPLEDAANFVVTVRTREASEAAGASIRAAVSRADPSVLVYDVQPMTARIEASLSNRRAPLVLAGIFAGVSLLLATIGIYGVLAYSVAQRRREIGVRMALGAQPGQIQRQFLGLGIRLLCIGLPLGMLGAWMAGRAIGGMLFGVEPLSPSVMAATAVVLAGAALPACLLPSRRAARVAPTEALRAD
jgi:predicted permease